MQILCETWKQEMKEKIRDPEFEFTTELPIAARYLILLLEYNKYAFKIMNLGSGIKKITRKTDTCPKCHGTGRV